MTHPTKPGQRCLVVGGRMAYNGEGQGPNQGKIVITDFCHPEPAGREQERVWRCHSADGGLLQTYYGVGQSADFLECWLKVIDPVESPAKALEKETEK